MIVVEREAGAVAQQSADRPSVEHLRARVASLAPSIKASAAQVEADRRVPMDLIEALREAGYFDVVKPKAFGGWECDFSALVDLNIDLAKSCASTAWVAGLLAAHQWLVGSCPAEAHRDV